MKQILRYLSVAFLCWFMVSCTYNHQLERTLKKAGANRTELESVLLHYKNDEKKYKAALFLLENMENCYSEISPMIDSLKMIKRQIVAHIYNSPSADSIVNVWKKKALGKTNKIYDAQVITAQFLIDNIDKSFEIWEKQPWAHHYSFEEFCRYILPYRIGNEPLESWREMYYRKFSQKVDSVYSGNDIIQKIQAVRTIFKQEKFYWEDHFGNLPHLGASYLFNYRLGGCEESCDYSVYILRSLGIPATTDNYIASPHTSGSHFWNVIRDTTGILVPFWMQETDVVRGGNDGRAKGKVFREEFGGEYRDVTAEYFGKNKAEVPINCTEDIKKIYLCVFSKGNYTPIAETRNKGDMAIFRNLEPNIRFFPMYYDKSYTLRFAGYPFCIDSMGKTITFVSDTLHRRKGVLRRKYSYHHHLKERGMRLSGSKWEGSVYSDFRSVYPLFTLPATLKTNRQIVKAESDAEIRYVRWLATPSNFNVHAAEIAFYDAKSNKEIPYKVMNIPEPMNEKYKTANMQDHNVLSYYQAKENGAQILTFDLGNYYQLKEMLYTPWNDDNYVSPGEEYELFYHNGIGGWQSLGKQMATSDSLVYDNIPSNAILWLRNLTKGKEEQQFIIDQEGNQSFH